MAIDAATEQAAEAATRLLAQAYGQLERLESADPIAIAQSLGVDVFTAKLPTDVAGLLVQRRGQDPQIHLNSSDSMNRQRFTCAHELGHYIQSAESGAGEIDRIDRRDDLASRGTAPEEIWANSFAAQLLMPHQVVRPAWKRGARIPDLAARLQVSVEAMTVRVRALGLQS